MGLCIFSAAPFWKTPQVFVGINVPFPIVEAKTHRLSSPHPLAPRMWNDGLGLDKWALPSRPLSSSNGRATTIYSQQWAGALSCSHVIFCLRKADSFLLETLLDLNWSSNPT